MHAPFHLFSLILRDIWIGCLPHALHLGSSLPPFGAQDDTPTKPHQPRLPHRLRGPTKLFSASTVYTHFSVGLRSPWPAFRTAGFVSPFQSRLRCHLPALPTSNCLLSYTPLSHTPLSHSTRLSVFKSTWTNFKMFIC